MAITCDKCKGANCYITGELKSTCRSCGNVQAFAYSQVPGTDELITSLKVATNNNGLFLKNLARQFFFYDDKPDWQKHAIYHNMYIYLQYGESFKRGVLPVLSLPAEKQAAMLAGEIRMHTRQTKTDYRGIVLLHSLGTDCVEAAAFLERCSLVIGSSITSYAEDEARGLKLRAPTEGAELQHSDFTPRRYAYQLREFKWLTEPVKHAAAVNGFSPFTGDQTHIKIKWQ